MTEELFQPFRSREGRPTHAMRVLPERKAPCDLRLQAYLTRGFRLEHIRAEGAGKVVAIELDA